MATDNNLTDFLKGVADAIREKTNESGLINPQDFPERIAAIETGCGGGGQPEGTHAVRFIDVDGAELKTEYVADGGSATPPDNPERDYCTFVKWSGDYTDVTGDTVVRPQYRSSDGRSHYEIDVSPGERLALSIYHNNSEELTIDWGDGTSDTVEKSGTWRSLTHEYTASVKGWVHISDAADDQISLSQVGAKGFIKGYIDSGKSSTLRERCRGCINLGYMVIPEGVRTIADYAAELCGNMASVVIPDGVTSIGSYAFQNCVNALFNDLPASLTGLDSMAFFNCARLTGAVSLPGVTGWLSDTFGQTGILSFSAAATTMTRTSGPGALGDCQALVRVELPNVVTFGDWTCRNDAALKLVILGESVTGIGSASLMNCASLERLVVKAATPPTLVSDALQGCSALQHIYVPDDSVETYKAATNWVAFADIILPLSEFTE